MKPTWVLILFLFASSLEAAACSTAACLGNGMAMRSNFQVVITHNGKPVVGAKVEIWSYGPADEDAKESSTNLSMLTGNDGTTSIRDLKPGNYNISASYLGMFAGEDCFHISKERGAKDKISYEWGEMPVGVRAVAGTVREWVPSPGASPIERLAHIHGNDAGMAGVHLSLVALDTKNAREAFTGSDGNFVLPDVPAGEYVLVLSSTGANATDTRFLLQVNPNSARYSLSFVLTNVCGPGFELKQ